MAQRVNWQRPEWVEEGSNVAADLRFLETIWRGGPLQVLNGQLRPLSGWNWVKYKLGWNCSQVDDRVRQAIDGLLYQIPAQGADARRIQFLCFGRLAYLSQTQFNRASAALAHLEPILMASQAADEEAREAGLDVTDAGPTWQRARNEIRLALRLRCANAAQLVGGSSLYNWFFGDVGTTGVYFMRDRFRNIRGVFKPEDEQLDNSPRSMQRIKYWFQTGPMSVLPLPQGHECLRRRGAPRAEAAAWQLMRQLPVQGSVEMPETHLTALSSMDFYRYGSAKRHANPITKLGSLSLFVPNSRLATSAEEPQVPHMAVYLDALTGGLDRKISSFLRVGQRWVMIDFGASFPYRHPVLSNSRRNKFLWRHYPHTQQRWADAVRRFHTAAYELRDRLDLSLLDPQQRAELMRRWELIDASIRADDGTPRQLADRILNPPQPVAVPVR